MEIEHITPDDIECKSMEIIESEIGDTSHLSDIEKNIVKRVIHTTADFDYLKNLKFSNNAVKNGLEAIRKGTIIITDTNMALSGICKPALKELGCEADCFDLDSDVAEAAKNLGTTRAVASVNKAAMIYGDRNFIYAVGNAPTALIRLHELITEGIISPSLIIGVPVGFVNAIHSKELIMANDSPYIVSKGRKGGSSISVAIINAMLYQIYKRN